MNTRKLVITGTFGALAFVIMLISVPIIPAAPFLTLDLSDVVAMLAAFTFGPFVAVGVEFIKNFLHYLTNGSAAGVPVDQVANFTAGILLILPAYFVAKENPTGKKLILGLAVGVVSMTVFMSIFNYFVYLPLYFSFTGFDSEQFNDALNYIVTIIVPFNVIKGVVVSTVFYFVYPRVSKSLERLKK